MPISPTAIRSVPSRISSSARAAPLTIAVRHSASVMAFSRLMSPVPFRTRRFLTPGCPEKSRIPTSAGITLQPVCCAMVFAVLRPSARAMATFPVTSLPHWLTPWATTPLSAQNTTSAFFSRRKSTCPFRAAIRMIISSKSPRLPRGFATAFQRASANARVLSSARRISRISSSIFIMLFILRARLYKSFCQRKLPSKVQMRKTRIQRVGNPTAAPASPVCLLRQKIRPVF